MATVRQILEEDLKHHKKMIESYSNVKPQLGKEVSEGVIKQLSFHRDVAEALEAVLQNAVGDERFRT